MYQSSSGGPTGRTPVLDLDLDQELHIFTEIHHTKGDLGAAIRLLTNARVIDIEEARRLSDQVERVYPSRRRNDA